MPPPGRRANQQRRRDMTNNLGNISARALSVLSSGCILFMAAAGALSAAPAATQAAATLVSIDAEGTQFKAIFADGRVLRSPELVGATLTVAVNGGTRR